MTVFLYSVTPEGGRAHPSGVSLGSPSPGERAFVMALGYVPG